MPNMNDVFAVILGGGRGTRLYPLTQPRPKSAMPIAGKYRLIDIPISNCINSGVFRMAVLSQFNSDSLHNHITTAYDIDTLHLSMQIFAGESTSEKPGYYRGTADAVRKRLAEIQNTGAKYTLILARSQVANGVTIKDSIVMGAEGYAPIQPRSAGIGANCDIEGAILDENVSLGEGVIIRPFPRDFEMDCANWLVRDGIVIVPKNAEIAAGAVLAPQAFVFNVPSYSQTGGGHD